MIAIQRYLDARRAELMARVDMIEALQGEEGREELLADADPEDPRATVERYFRSRDALDLELTLIRDEMERIRDMLRLIELEAIRRQSDERRRLTS